VQFLERFALGRLALAQHLSQLGSAEPFGDRGEPAAGRHRRELAAVANGDHLRASALGVREQRSRRASRRRARCIEQHDRARLEPVPFLQLPEEPVDREGRDPRGIAKLARGAAGRRDAENQEPAAS
jgi:hypothetical protein